MQGADVADDRDATPQSPGLLAVAEGFPRTQCAKHHAVGRTRGTYALPTVAS